MIHSNVMLKTDKSKLNSSILEWFLFASVTHRLVVLYLWVTLLQRPILTIDVVTTTYCFCNFYYHIATIIVLVAIFSITSTVFLAIMNIAVILFVTIIACAASTFVSCFFFLLNPRHNHCHCCHCCSHPHHFCHSWHSMLIVMFCIGQRQYSHSSHHPLHSTTNIVILNPTPCSFAFFSCWWIVVHLLLFVQQIVVKWCLHQWKNKKWIHEMRKVKLMV